jgi:hypothetical protein
MTQERATEESFRYPTPEEMLALDRAARRARAEAIASLFTAAGRQLKELIRRGADAPRTSSQLPTEGERKTMTTLFWRNALASLPPSVQRRYATAFEAAERFEAVLDLGIEVWRFAKGAFAKTSRVAAQAMRGTARTLDPAAHRTLPEHRAESY